jgi:hypothetical protein
MFSLALLTKPSGRPRAYQLTEFRLRTPLSSFLATDIPSLLILNSKDKNG